MFGDLAQSQVWRHRYRGFDVRGRHAAERACERHVDSDVSTFALTVAGRSFPDPGPSSELRFFSSTTALRPSSLGFSSTDMFVIEPLDADEPRTACWAAVVCLVGLFERQLPPCEVVGSERKFFDDVGNGMNGRTATVVSKPTLRESYKPVFEVPSRD